MHSPNTSFAVLYISLAMMFVCCDYTFDAVNAHIAKYYYSFFLVKYVVSRTVSSRTSIHHFNATNNLGYVPGCIMNFDWKLLYK
jgi:hypothetical protein